MYDLNRYLTNDIDRYMPQRRQSVLEPNSKNFVLHTLSSLELDRAAWDIQDTIQQAWTSVYDKASREISNLTIGRPEHFVLRLIPGVEEVPVWQSEVGLRLSLIIELFLVDTPNVIIPKMEYSNGKLIEWKCGSCGMPNPIEAHYCGEKFKEVAGCGRPRALLIQELL